MRRGGDIDRTIARIAAANGGVVSLSALAAAGVGRRAVEHRVSIGRLHRVHGGVYLLLPPQDATRVTLFAAAVVACGEDALLSHFSAAELWGLLARRPGDAEIDVMLAGRNPGTRAGIRRHRVPVLDERDASVHHGIAVTSPARAVLDLAVHLSAADLEQLSATASSKGRADGRDIQAVLERYPRHRGAARLKAMMRTPGGPQLTRSQNERSVLSLVRQARLKPPAMNVRPAGFEVDAYWPQERLVVEADGYEFHRDRVAFENDRARDATLVAAGFRVIRVTWRQLDDEPFVVIGRIAQALGVAGARGHAVDVSP
jgi:very-short-patch-repair endonuclease